MDATIGPKAVSARVAAATLPLALDSGVADVVNAASASSAPTVGSAPPVFAVALRARADSSSTSAIGPPPRTAAASHPRAPSGVSTQTTRDVRIVI